MYKPASTLLTLGDFRKTMSGLAEFVNEERIKDRNSSDA